MPGRVEGKVAFITGAARGQGRSHALRLAGEGADIIAVDVCADIDTVPYPGATETDLAETAKLVEGLGRRVVAAQADVRDHGALSKVLDDAVGQLGRLDIVCANAGIFSTSALDRLTERAWEQMIDINLGGVWRTCKAAVPLLADGGSIVITSSAAGLRGVPNAGHYAAAKHGVIGLMRSLSLELAPRSIRVNCVNPVSVDTDMLQNAAMYELFLPGVEDPTREQFAEAAGPLQALPIPWVEAIDVSNAVLFLASEESRYITGVTLPIDGGHA